MNTIRCGTVVAVTLFCLCCVGAEESYYQRYLRIVDTSGEWPKGIRSHLLIDTNNTTAKVTNVVIHLGNLRTNGEISGIRLGMTTDEVVARWGMPLGLQCSSATGPWFSFTDIGLRFKANALYRVDIPETARFDHELRGDSALKDWVRVLGEPTMRRENQHGISLVYETRGVVRTVLSLTFNPDGNMRFAPILLSAPEDPQKWFNPSKP